MPINYKNGKIYEIVCRVSGEKYVGSTTQPLTKRLVEHRDLKRNKTISKQIIERGDYYINLIEECPCDNREQLLKRERHFYDSIEGGCINKYRPWVSREEDKAYEKAYYEENKEQILAVNKAYREENREQILAQRKAKRKENKEQIKERNKAYYEQNKERALAYRKAYYEENKEQIITNVKAYKEKIKNRL
jgi:hypothetical protein